MKQILLAAVIALITFGVSADDLDDIGEAAAAYKREDYETAFEKLRPVADKGNPTAQALLSGLYFWGFGVPRNYKTSFDLMQKAARANGEPNHEVALGKMYRQGIGTPRDYEKAVHWMRKAADKRSPSAMYSLGGLYEAGEGVERDLVKAYFLYNQSAAKGIRKADRALLRIERELTDKQIARAQSMTWEEL